MFQTFLSFFSSSSFLQKTLTFPFFCDFNFLGKKTIIISSTFLYLLSGMKNQVPGVKIKVSGSRDLSSWVLFCGEKEVKIWAWETEMELWFEKLGFVSFQSGFGWKDWCNFSSDWILVKLHLISGWGPASVCVQSSKKQKERSCTGYQHGPC